MIKRNETRRELMMKTGATIAGVSMLGAANAKPISTAGSRTYLTISEFDGDLVDYKIVTESSDLRPGNAADPGDNISRNPRKNVAIARGTVLQGHDTDTFQTVLEDIDLSKI